MGNLFWKYRSYKNHFEWYLWMHHTIDKIPDIKEEKKYHWQKDHSENMTGTKKSYKPVKINKSDVKKKI